MSSLALNLSSNYNTCISPNKSLIKIEKPSEPGSGSNIFNFSKLELDFLLIFELD